MSRTRLVGTDDVDDQVRRAFEVAVLDAAEVLGRDHGYREGTLAAMHAAVFLDRDNTIIHNDGDLGDPDQVVLIKGAATAIASLCGLGYRVFVVTNQGGVARGKYTEQDVEQVHARLAELVEKAANGAKIHGFYYCPYHPEGKVAKYKKEHPTRKPQPGMLLQAAEEHGLDLGQSWMVGDAMRDCQAGAAAGCRTILVREDADRLAPLDMAGQPGAATEQGAEDGAASPSGGCRPDFMAASLVDAVRIIAQQRKPDTAEAQRPRKWDASAVARLQRARRPSDDVAQEPGEGESEHRPPSAAQRQPSRPFRPWNAPDATADPAKRAEPRSSRRARPGPQDAEAPATEPAAESDAKPAPPPEPPRPPDSSAPPPPQPAPRPAPPVGEPSPTTEADAVLSGSYKTLRLILQELRAQRTEATDHHHAPLKTFALVLQIIAVLCLIGALWMGAANDALFIRWWATAIFLQMTVLAALMFGRRR